MLGGVFGEKLMWLIEKTNMNGDFKPIGTFQSTVKGFEAVKRAIDIYVDIKEGEDVSFPFTKTKV